MKAIVIDVNQEDTNKLQRNYFEVNMLNARLNILTENHRNDVGFFDSDVYKKLSNQLVDLQMDYEKNKQIIIQPYIPKEYKDRKNEWSLDFQTSKLTIFIGDE